MEQEITSTICPLCLEREGHLGSCFSCSGKGFKILLGEEKVACNRCNGTGRCIHPCNLCLEFGNPLRQPLRCQYCYVSKAGNSFRVEGSNAEEVEKVARSLLREEKLLEIQSKITEARIREFQTFSEAIYKNNLDIKSDLPEINPLKLFISYSRLDRRFLTKLKAHLEPLRQNGLIQVWCDQEIKAGSNREEVISEHLNTAQIIILLLSAEFVASNYCSSNEMKRAIERHERGEIHVIPIIVRPVLWELVLIPIHKLHILPKNGKPITDPFWVTQDRAFHEVTKGIYDIVEELIKKGIS